MPTAIPFIEIESDNPFDFGLKIGSALKYEIQARIKRNTVEYVKAVTRHYDELTDTVLKYLPKIEKCYPDILLEMSGIAAGANIDLKELLVAICEEELIYYNMAKCTTIAFISDKHEAILGHNEDWLPMYLENGMYVIKAKLNQQQFISLSYMGSLPGSSCSITSAGLAFSGNSINGKRFRYGIPKVIQMRAMLAAKNIRQASRIDTTLSTIPSNTMYALPHGKILDVEDFWKHKVSLRSGHLLIHTNHPIRKEDQNKENTHSESVRRLNKVKEIAGSVQTFNEDAMKMLLKTHDTGICGHVDANHPDYGVTIASCIINADNRSIEICHGTPCNGQYVKYELS